MIRIEIISVQPQDITLALYYPVPPSIYSSASEDPARTPAGNGLSAPELQALKEGRLYEVMRTVDPMAKTQAEMRDAVEKLWDDTRGEAKTQYIQAYSYMNLPDIVGRTWDGDTWS